MRTDPGWQIGRLAGVPVYLGRSWVLVALLVIALFGPTVAQVLPDLDGVSAYAVAGVFALLLLVSVLVHEAAHALMAQAVGFGVSRIVADFWGGHTAHDGAGGTAGRSAAVAVVGPLSNGVLAVLGWWLVGALDPGVPLLLAYAFAWANTFVAVFNLVPGLPLDGGFLLEALVWGITGNRHLGTMVAGWAGRAVVLLLALWALAPVLSGQQLSLVRVVWVLLIGAFLWQGASAAVRSGRHGARASRRTVGQAAHRAGTVGQDTPLAQVDWDSHRIWVVLGADGHPDGVVDPATLDRVPPEYWAGTPVSAVAVRLPPGWAVAMDEQVRLDRVIEVMRSTGSGVVGLLDEGGRPWGVVVVDDLTGPRS